MTRSVLNASLIALIALVIGFSFTQSFAEKPADGDKAPAKQKEKAEKPKSYRLFFPYNEVQLTDEQKAKIAELRAETNAKKKALDEAEEAAIQQLLTDEQKAQATKLRDEKAAKDKADREARSAKMKAEREAAKAKEAGGEKEKAE